MSVVFIGDGITPALLDDLYLLARFGSERMPHFSEVAHEQGLFSMKLARAIEPELWRVAVQHRPKPRVEAVFLGMGEQITIKGSTVTDLPRWMQERLSVLNMLSESPPTTPIPGVGRRISEHVYWIVE